MSLNLIVVSTFLYFVNSKLYIVMTLKSINYKDKIERKLYLGA